MGYYDLVSTGGNGEGSKAAGGESLQGDQSVMQQSQHVGGVVMSIIGWILFGLIVGVVAKLIMPGRDPGGMIVTILLGIGGALLGGFIGRALGWYGEGDPVGFIMAVIGSILVLFAYRKISSSPRVGA